ncbi:MAG: hypothetical protein HY898_31495 [Deltaproteobacteria bacterium]|nr:hypothetical protein [Deltaproteobacteria bacterium]
MARPGSATGKFGWLLVGVAVAAWGCSSMLGYDEVDFGEVQPDPDGGAGGIGPTGGGAGNGGAQAGNAGNGGKTGAGGGAGQGGAAGGSAGAGGGAAGTGGGAAGTGGGPAGAGGTPPGPCTGVVCGSNQHCEPATKSCVCNPGFVSNGADCTPAPAGDPSQHTQQDVCDHWAQGHNITDPSPWTPGPNECDPGTLSQAGITDTLTRMAMFRWMVGLGPVSDDPALNQMDMYCAAVSSWNPPGGGYNPHQPDPSRKCYTPEGANGAGQSNIAWGSGHPAQAIDQFVQDNGNETTMGHRRWIFNPPLGPVGIGYYAGGGPYGNAECLAVFGQSGGGTTPTWISFPPPGFSPVEIVSWMWTFHHSSGVSNATIKVTRQSDSADLAMTTMPLIQGFGNYPTIGFNPSGWSPKAGDVYVVEVGGVGSGTITYEVKPVNCP